VGIAAGLRAAVGHSSALLDVEWFGVWILDLAYAVVFIGVWSGTLGMRIVRIWAVDGTTQGRVAWRKAALRAVAAAVIVGAAQVVGEILHIISPSSVAKHSTGATILTLVTLVLSLTYLWPLKDARNRTLWDKVAGTVVVRAARPSPDEAASQDGPWLADPYRHGQPEHPGVADLSRRAEQWEIEAPDPGLADLHRRAETLRRRDAEANAPEDGT
jgi:uncharacterized RDD family membrane protein YckC